MAYEVFCAKYSCIESCCNLYESSRALVYIQMRMTRETGPRTLSSQGGRPFCEIIKQMKRGDNVSCKTNSNPNHGAEGILHRPSRDTL